MAYPSYTYTLTNSTTADATQVMQNYNDILNGISDGTKDISVNALTVAGAATLNGNITLGNATSDDLTATGRWASNLDPKTAATYDHGTSSQTWRAMYLDNGATDSGAIYFDAGTTKFIKGSADGTTLNIGGFVKLNSDSNLEYMGRTNSATGTAGYIGETITNSSAVTTTNLTPNDTFVDVNNASITLNRGVWLFTYSAAMEIGSGSGLGDRTYGSINVSTGGSVVGNSERIGCLVKNAVATLTGDVGQSISGTFVLVVSADSTVYKLRAKRIDSQGTATSAVVLGDLANYYRSHITAVRIA